MILARPFATRIRPLGFLLAAVVVAAVSQLVVALDRQAAPERPIPVTAQLEPPVLDLSSIDRQLKTWSAKAEANDDDYISATNLGILYLGRARLTGDLADYERASAAAERGLAADPGYVPARALDATVRYSLHDFDGAVSAAESLLADVPGQVDALAVLADASLELGRLDEARSVYQELGQLAPGPALDVRLARLAYLTGDPAHGLELARQARDPAGGPGQPSRARESGCGPGRSTGGDRGGAPGSRDRARTCRGGAARRSPRAGRGPGRGRPAVRDGPVHRPVE
jgi:tetratricopeptide (TPR) repeat protein